MGMDFDFEVELFDASKYPVLVPETQQVFVEVFSATWCGWCYHAYEVYDRLSSEYGLPIHHVRYYNQDELAMENASRRALFYSATGFPVLVVNGEKKIVGADDQSYPRVAEWVEDYLQHSPLAGVYTYAKKEADQLSVTAYIQNHTEQDLDVRFLSVLMENNVMSDRNRRHNYVAREVFPDYDGLRLHLSSNHIYRIEFSFPLPNMEKLHDYKIASFIQNFETKKIYNSSFFEMDSLSINKHYPEDFSDNVPRDNRLSISFEEPLSVSSINEKLFSILDKDGNVISPQLEYFPADQKMIVDPMTLLKSNTGYALMIQGGGNALASSSRKTIRDYYCLPFKTGESPEINIDISPKNFDFGSITVIDKPMKTTIIEEKNQNAIRLQIKSMARWIDPVLEEIKPSKYLLHFNLLPLFMQTGANQGSVQIQTITGQVDISVDAYLESTEYPALRVDYIPYVTLQEQAKIYGRTNGYRLFVNNKEIAIAEDGYFEGYSGFLNPGFNVVVLRTINMQRKETQKAFIIFRLD